MEADVPAASVETVLSVRAGCSLQCSFCARSPDRTGVAPDEVLDPAFPLPASARVLLVAGDVVRPELAPLVRRLRDAGAREVVAYAHAATDVAALRSLADAGLTGVLVQIPSADARRVTRLTRGTASMRRLAALLDAAIALGLSIELDVAVVDTTLPDLADTVRRALNRVPGASAVQLSFVAAAVDGPPRPWDFRRAAPAVRAAIDACRERGVPARFGQPVPPPCLFDADRADTALYPVLRELRDAATPGPDAFAACVACVLRGTCLPAPAHFATEPSFGPVRPVVPSTPPADPQAPATSTELFLRRRDLSRALRRLADAPPVPCTAPWTVLSVGPGAADVDPCGNLRTDGLPALPAAGGDDVPLAEAWNSPRMRAVRRALATSGSRETCRADCPAFFGVTPGFEALSHLPATRPMHRNLLLQVAELLERAEVLRSLPSRLVLAPDTLGEPTGTGPRSERPRTDGLPEPRFRSVLALLPTLRNLVLAGDDPVGWPRFLDLVRACDAVAWPDLALTLTTGLTPLDPPTVPDLARARFRRIVVSLAAATPATHRSLTGLPDGFERTIDGLRALLDAAPSWRERPPILLAFPLVPANLGELGAFLDLARSLGCEARLVPAPAGDRRESVLADPAAVRHALAVVLRDAVPRAACWNPAMQREVRVLEARLRSLAGTA